jgi:hypothetical protein
MCRWSRVLCWAIGGLVSGNTPQDVRAGDKFVLYTTSSVLYGYGLHVTKTATAAWLTGFSWNRELFPTHRPCINAARTDWQLP